MTFGSVFENRLVRSYHEIVSQVNGPHLKYDPGPYSCECVPFPPKVRVRDDADGFPKLGLDIGWRCNHEADKALLDDLHFILRELVVAFLILQPVY